MTASSILVVEDEAVVALDLKMRLEGLGYRVVGVADNAEQALDLARRHRPQLALMDVQLRGKVDGIQTAAVLQRELATPVVFLTSFNDPDTVRRAAETGAYGYLTKPFQIKELTAGIEIALYKSRMELQLREADRWFAATLNCVSDAVVVSETDTRIRFMNPAAEALTGWPAELAMGRPVAEVVHIAAPPGAAVRTLEGGDAVGVEHALVLHARDGRRRTVDRSAAPIDDDDGQRLGAVLILRDAGDRLRNEEQLAELTAERMKREASDTASRMKTEFLSRVSHEMRTPLNAVLGFGQLLQRGAGNGDASKQAFADHIVHAGTHLLDMVNDLLDIQNGEQGMLKLDMQSVALHEAAAGAIELLRPAAQTQRIRLEADLATAAQVRADPKRLRQVLLNLGSNAVKYNRPGGTVSMSLRIAAGGRVHLTVQDDGIGMTPDQLARLFQPFERLGRETSAVPGTGLGLVIAKNLVEQMGGRMVVTSEPRVGTAVMLEFEAH